MYICTRVRYYVWVINLCLLVVLYFTSTEISLSQLSISEPPGSMRSGYLSSFKPLTIVELEARDIERFRNEDLYNDKLDDQPFRFGVNIFVDLNPENSGVWDTVADGRIWRLALSSPGALSLNFTFNRFRLPKGARLHIYNELRTEILGAFSAINNQPDNYFATTLLFGDKAIIEYFEPNDATFSGELNLWRVTHGYRSINNSIYRTFEESDSCNINVACPEGDGLRDQIRSVVLILFGGDACTGTLINNTNQDETPYILSANHCFQNPGAAVFHFNYQSVTCGNPGTSPTSNSLSGAVTRANFSGSDFWLMELFQVPPAGYNVYYAGWNRTSAPAISGRLNTVHHPMADIKKISWTNYGVVKSFYPTDENSHPSSHWRVSSWSKGTTQDGSSGAPLFDPFNRVIGQLHGGQSACGNILSDYYGRLSYSWAGGNSQASRLSDWLDPLGTGVTVFQGYDPNASQFDTDAELSAIQYPVSQYATIDSIEPRVLIRNNGLDQIRDALVSYRLDDQALVTQEWSGTLVSGAAEQIVFPKISSEVGTHNFVAIVNVADDENPGNDSLVREFVIANCALIELPFFEGFDSVNLSPCWNKRSSSDESASLNNVSEGVFPDIYPNQGTRMLEFNSFSADSGNSVRLEIPSFPSSGMDSLEISFDWYHTNSDSLAEDLVLIQYTHDNQVWMDIDTVYRYNPDSTGWMRKTVVLPAELDNQELVYLSLKFISGKGLNCHLDSLLIQGSDIEEPYPDFIVQSPNAYLFDTVVFADASLNGPFESWLWEFGSGANPATAEGIGPHKVVYNSLGYKSVRLTIDDTLIRYKPDHILVEKLVFSPPYNLSGEAEQRDVELTWALFSDGFETNDFSKWEQVIDGPGEPGDIELANWFIDKNVIKAYEGRHYAKVAWGYNIDSWLISPRIPVDRNTILSFYWQGSYAYNVDPYDRGDLFVKVSVDSGQNWQPIWTFGEIGVWEDYFWYNTVIDLSAYDQELLQIAFNVEADDNGDIFLDDIYFGNEGDRSFESSRIPGKSSTKTIGDHTFTSKTYRIGREKNSELRQVILVDYTIFRDGEIIGTSSDNYYFDRDLPAGQYRYYVVANYSNPDGVSIPSNTVSVTVRPENLPPGPSGSSPRIYPNPTDGILSIEADRNYQIDVFNMKGIKLESIELLNGADQIDLSAHPEGMYLLHIKSKSSSSFLKIFIQH